MNTNNVAERAIAAVVSGLIAGVVTALVVYVISLVLPAVSLDPGFWGTVVGVLVGLATFFTGKSHI